MFWNFLDKERKEEGNRCGISKGLEKIMFRDRHGILKALREKI